MEACRELDALIAERVMGQTNFEHDEIGETPAGDPQCWRCREIGAWGDSIFGDIKCIPHYSTSIAAAWQVVERLAGLGMLTSVCWGRSGNHGVIASVDILEAGFDKPIAAPTAPLAICLAALKAFNISIN